MRLATRSKKLSSFVEDKDRKIIPRWRDFREAWARRELEPLHPVQRRPVEDTHFREKLRDWQTYRTLPFATELVGAAIVLQRESEAREAADFILSARPQPSLAVQVLARRVVAPEDTDQPAGNHVDQRTKLHQLRATLREEPRNALRWADLSLQYASIGKTEAAARAMGLAVGLAPNDRFVLRSAARFYIHKGDPGQAHFLLLRAQATDSDPWLLAAEIAVSSMLGRTSDLIKTGRDMLSPGSYQERHISELASALGTVEMQSAAGRQAGKLFKRSLADPTENSVAQARWVCHQFGGLDLDPAWLSTPGSYEARAWTFFHAANWNDALSESMRWLSDQPFSSRPAVLGSYVAAVCLQDLNESIRLARAGLAANRGDPVLLNNLAYALAVSGLLDEAEQALSRIRNTAGEPAIDAIRLATSGLVHYRRGNSSQGRQLYRQAIDTAGRASLHRLKAKATIFLALEENRVRSPEAQGSRERAVQLARGFVDADVSNLVARLTTPPHRG